MADASSDSFLRPSDSFLVHLAGESVDRSVDCSTWLIWRAGFGGSGGVLVGFWGGGVDVVVV